MKANKKVKLLKGAGKLLDLGRKISMYNALDTIGRYITYNLRQRGLYKIYHRTRRVTSQVTDE